MKRPYLLGLLIILTTMPAPAATVVISDFNNTGFDVYSGTGWPAGAVNGAQFLTIGSPAITPGSATFSDFINAPLPDLTGTTQLTLDLRLVSGNQADQFNVALGTLGGANWVWDFGPGVLNTSTFTTLVFEYANPTFSQGTLDLANPLFISFGTNYSGIGNVNFAMQFDNFIATDAIPEPASSALIMAAGVALVAWRRRGNLTVDNH